MISHFSWKPLFKKEKLPGWRISFYWQGTHYEGIYHKSGDIEWGHTSGKRRAGSRKRAA